MSDTIFLKGLALHAYHGVMQHEAKVGQTFYVDLQLDLELGNASRTDKLKDTVSYDFVIKTVAEAFCGRLPPGGRGRRRGGRRRIGTLPASAQRPCHGAQAARAGRGNIRGCRRDN